MRRSGCGAHADRRQPARITSARLAADLDEARAQVWGLICIATMGSGASETRQSARSGTYRLWAHALTKNSAKVAELTATHDPLTAETRGCNKGNGRPWNSCGGAH